MVVKANRMLYTPLADESLIPPDQMSWYGLSVDSTSIGFGGRQSIIGKDFELPLWWDGKTTYFKHVVTKASDKALGCHVLTSDSDYKPRQYAQQKLMTALLQDASMGQVVVKPVEPTPQDGPDLTGVKMCVLHAAPTKDAIGDFEYQKVRVRRRYLWESNEHVWLPHQLTEWKRRFGYISDEGVKKTFQATTQLVPSVRHENEQFPKDSQVSRFPYFPCRRLRETVYCDIVEYPLEDNERVKMHGLIFYGGKSKILALYHLGKDTSSAKVLGFMYEFARDFGCPDTFASDFANNLAKSDKWKRFTRVTMTKIHASESGKQNSNHVERAWQDLQKHGRYTAKTHGVPKQHRYAMFQHLCDCHNHTALSSLNWRTPLETLSGDTPDISVFRYYFWEMCWYKEATNVPQKQTRWVKGRFIGIAWTTGDTMCFRVVPEAGFDRTVHRTVVVPRHPDEKMPRELLKHPSDHYFPTPKPPIKPSPLAVGRKKRTRDQTDDDAAEAEATKPYEVNGEEENKLREKYLKEAKEHDEILKELSTPLHDVMDIDHIDSILKHHFKGKHGDADRELHFRVKLLNGSIVKAVSLSEMKIDAPVALSQYLLKSSTLKKDPKLYKYAKSMQKTHERILKLTSERKQTLGISDHLIEEAGQVSARRAGSMQPRRSKKASPNKRKSNPMGKFKYGTYVPKNVEDALRVDTENGNHLWQEAIISEVHSLWSMKTFKLLTKSQQHNLKDTYQFAPLRLIFDVKESGRRKARVVIGGHVIDSLDHDTYASTMKTISARALLLVASANKLEVLTGDISTAYLHASNTLKVAVRLGPEFELYDKALAGRPLASVEQALYGLAPSANRWAAHLADTLRSIGFRRTRFDPDVWIRRADDHYEYIGTHTDDLMIVGKDPRSIMTKLEQSYTIKSIGPPRFHLGCDYRRNDDGTWSIGTKTYVEEAIRKVKNFLGKEDNANGEDTLGFDNTPMATSLKPEIDKTDLCDVETHRKYQQLVGIAQWLITCGRLDLSFAISSLSRFSHAPRKGHMKAAIQVFKYLNANRDKWIHLDPSDHVPPGELTDPTEVANIDWRQYYDKDEEGEKDEINHFPTPLGTALTTAVYFDSNWAHDEKTRKSISGVVSFVGNCPISWLSRRQGAIATSTYSAELIAAKVGTEEVISIRYMLRSLGVPLKGPTLLIGDNLGALISATAPGSLCKKRAVNIAYHMVREANASGILTVKKIHTDFNPSDPWTKALNATVFWNHFRFLFQSKVPNT
jgi:hypothetical protein